MLIIWRETRPKGCSGTVIAAVWYRTGDRGQSSMDAIQFPDRQLPSATQGAGPSCPALASFLISSQLVCSGYANTENRQIQMCVAPSLSV